MRYSRRSFLIAAAGAAGAVVGGDAFAVEPARVLVSRHEVPVPGLGRAFDGMRLAQVTDVHFPGNVAAAGAALAHLQREKPEIVVITGDMTERAAGLESVAAFAREARGTLATVATLGNWEYLARSASRAGEVYRSVGVELLVNAHRDIRVGGSSLVLVGTRRPRIGSSGPARCPGGDAFGWAGNLAGARAWLRVACPGCTRRPRVHPVRAHPRRTDPPALPAGVYPGRIRTLRCGLVSRHLRAVVRLARNRDDDPSGQVQLPAGTSHFHTTASLAASPFRCAGRGRWRFGRHDSVFDQRLHPPGRPSLNDTPGRAAAAESNPQTAPGSSPRRPGCPHRSDARRDRTCPALGRPAPRGGAWPACC